MNTSTKDIVVVGGGTTGCAAAISSTRRGHRVLLVEENNCLWRASASAVTTGRPEQLADDAHLVQHGTSDWNCRCASR